MTKTQQYTKTARTSLYRKELETINKLIATKSQEIHLLRELLHNLEKEQRKLIKKRWIRIKWLGKDILTPRKEKILEMRFKNRSTLEEVGRYFGVTRERIRMLEAEALDEIGFDEMI